MAFLIQPVDGECCVDPCGRGSPCDPCDSTSTTPSLTTTNPPSNPCGSCQNITTGDFPFSTITQYFRNYPSQFLCNQNGGQIINGVCYGLLNTWTWSGATTNTQTCGAEMTSMTITTTSFSGSTTTTSYNQGDSGFISYFIFYESLQNCTLALRNNVISSGNELVSNLQSTFLRGNSYYILS